MRAIELRPSVLEGMYAMLPVLTLCAGAVPLINEFAFAPAGKTVCGVVQEGMKDKSAAAVLVIGLVAFGVLYGAGQVFMGFSELLREMLLSGNRHPARRILKSVAGWGGLVVAEVKTNFPGVQTVEELFQAAATYVAQRGNTGRADREMRVQVTSFAFGLVLFVLGLGYLAGAYFLQMGFLLVGLALMVGAALLMLRFKEAAGRYAAEVLRAYRALHV